MADDTDDEPEGSAAFRAALAGAAAFGLVDREARRKRMRELGIEELLNDPRLGGEN